MRTKLSYLKLGFILTLSLITFFACEQDDEIYEQKERISFFSTNTALSEYENKLIKNVETIIPDSAQNEWRKTYGSPNFKNSKLITEENGAIMIIPVAKKKNKYDALLVVATNDKKISAEMFSNRDIISDKKHLLFIPYAKMQKERGNPLFQKYRFETEFARFVRVPAEECTGMYLGIDTQDGEYIEEFIGWNCKQTMLSVWVDDEVGGGSSGGGSGGGGIPYAPPTGGSFFGGGGSGGSNGSSTPSIPATPKVDDTEIENDEKLGCVKGLLEQGGENSLINKLIKGFEGTTPTSMNLTYKVQDKVYKKDEEVNGKCRRDPNNPTEITIYISKSRMNNSSFLEVARTILHETLHAHLNGMIYTEDNTAFNTISEIDELDFKRTWDVYETLHPEETQHNWMADRYIDLMKGALLNVYNDWNAKESFEEHYQVDDTNRDFMLECIAWYGLLHDKTEAGKEFYKKHGSEYEKMKTFTISGISRNCPEE